MRQRLSHAGRVGAETAEPATGGFLGSQNSKSQTGNGGAAWRGPHARLPNARRPSELAHALMSSRPCAHALTMRLVSVPNFLAYMLANTVRVKAQPCRPAEKETVPVSGWVCAAGVEMGEGREVELTASSSYTPASPPLQVCPRLSRRQSCRPSRRASQTCRTPLPHPSLPRLFSVPPAPPHPAGPSPALLKGRVQRKTEAKQILAPP